MSAELHVLLVPTAYPSRCFPVRGIFFQDQAHALRKAGLNVGVVATETRSLATLHNPCGIWRSFQTTTHLEEDIPVIRYHGWSVPKMRAVTGRLWVRWCLNLIGKYVAEYGKPDIIHAHCALWAGVAAAEAKARYGIPYCVTEHSTAFARGLVKPWHCPHILRAYDRAHHVIAVGYDLAEHITQFCADDKIVVIPNVVDTDYFRLPGEVRGVRPFHFVSIAALTKKKGMDLLLRAYTRAFANAGDVKLTIGGDGPCLPDLKKLARRLGIAQAVAFPGQLAREDVRRLLWEANCYVSASFFETFGVTMIEAMATGLPVIATKSGGPADFISDRTGMLIDVGEVDQMAAAMEVIRSAGNDWAERAQDISTYAESRFSEQAVSGRLIELYKSMTNST